MLKKWVGLAAAALALLVSGAALAAGGSGYNPNGEALPAGALHREQPVYELTQSGWVSVTSPDGDVLARSWNSGGALGYCNKAYWDVTFTTHASVAQWINWNLATTRKDWRIRKPGTFASDSIDFWIASNNAVSISFAGFGNLVYQNPHAPGDTDHEIEVYYGVGGDINEAEANGWVPAAQLNDWNLVLPDSEALHNGLAYKFWQKLYVSNSNSSSEYHNEGTVRLAVTNLKFWIDGETGHFKPDQGGTPPTEPYVPPTI